MVRRQPRIETKFISSLHMMGSLSHIVPNPESRSVRLGVCVRLYMYDLLRRLSVHNVEVLGIVMVSISASINLAPLFFENDLFEAVFLPISTLQRARALRFSLVIYRIMD